jgi:hypothetical protein
MKGKMDISSLYLIHYDWIPLYKLKNYRLEDSRKYNAFMPFRSFEKFTLISKSIVDNLLNPKYAHIKYIPNVIVETLVKYER